MAEIGQDKVNNEKFNIWEALRELKKPNTQKEIAQKMIQAIKKAAGKLRLLKTKTNQSTDTDTSNQYKKIIKGYDRYGNPVIDRPQ